MLSIPKSASWVHQTEEPSRPGHRSSDNILPAYHDWRRRNHTPNRCRAKIRCGLEREPGEVCRPTENHVCTLLVAAEVRSWPLNHGGVGVISRLPPTACAPPQRHIERAPIHRKTANRDRKIKTLTLAVNVAATSGRADIEEILAYPGAATPLKCHRRGVKS